MDHGIRTGQVESHSTCLQADVILIDEVIGVGDAHFYVKARQRVENLLHNSNILIISSHSIELLRQFCNKALLLEQGKIKAGDENHRLSSNSFVAI